MNFSCTGVILAGGMNTRFSGRNKTFLEVNGKRIFEWILEAFSGIFQEIIVVTNEPIKFIDWNLKIVTDIYPYRSSLTGIHTGLFFSSNPYIFCSACDTPFIQAELITTIVKKISTKTDIIIPETSDGLEPLCAVYSKKCITPIEQNLEQKNIQIKRFFNKVRVKKIGNDELRKTDPGLISFFNINTPEDLEKAKKIHGHHINI